MFSKLTNWYSSTNAQFREEIVDVDVVAVVDVVEEVVEDVEVVVVAASLVAALAGYW